MPDEYVKIVLKSGKDQSLKRFIRGYFRAPLKKCTGRFQKAIW
jgi:hypothetical protein